MNRDKASSLNNNPRSVRNLISNFEQSTTVAPKNNILKSDLFVTVDINKPSEDYNASKEKQSPKTIVNDVLKGSTSNEIINLNDQINDFNDEHTHSAHSQEALTPYLIQKNEDQPQTGEDTGEDYIEGTKHKLSSCSAISTSDTKKPVTNAPPNSPLNEDDTVNIEYQPVIDLKKITGNSETDTKNDFTVNSDEGDSPVKKFNYFDKPNEPKENKDELSFNSDDDIFIGFDNDSIQNSKLFDWKFGDIDGLDKFSMAITPASLEPNDDNNENLNNDGTVTLIAPRNRTVSFKDSDIPFHEKSSEPDLNIPNTKTINPWKYIFYGLLVGILIIYVITLTFKEIFTSQRPVTIITEKDLFEYFGNSTNNARVSLINKVAKKYNIYLEAKYIETPKLNKYSPRIDDGDIIIVHNDFEHISMKYQNDVEVKNNMVNDNLTFMFSGIAYAPANVIEPVCGANLRDVILDIARLSKITGRVRTYGTQCNQGEYILQAIHELQVNMTLSLGVWIGSDESNNQKQLQEMKRLLETYPRQYFHSIFIGNEVIYRGDKSVKELMNYIETTKLYLKSINYTDLPVGTSEIGSKISNEMFESCDFVGANIHPFFGGVDAQFGTRWTLDYFYNQLLPLRDASNIDTKLIISEVGWPYQGGEFIRSTAGRWEFQQFLNDWLCFTPANILNDCFYFEAFDEPWKQIWWDKDKTWETEWGFFDEERNMKKQVYIPDCSKYRSSAMIGFEYIENVDNPYDDENNED